MHANVVFASVLVTELLQHLSADSSACWAWQSASHITHACRHFSRVQLCSPINCNPPGSSVHGIL